MRVMLCPGGAGRAGRWVRYARSSGPVATRVAAARSICAGTGRRSGPSVGWRARPGLSTGGCSRSWFVLEVDADGAAEGFDPQQQGGQVRYAPHIVFQHGHVVLAAAHGLAELGLGEAELVSALTADCAQGFPGDVHRLAACS